MTPRRQEDWHRHGMRSPEDIAGLLAARLGGADETLRAVGPTWDEPSYADFLGEQL
ncbi:hypothetical protein ACIPEP_05750 [Curtobacterium sp. NPDC087082]|uniref:hypothetical protein n=1 Tax=unclassified Curtobacterium TaxID=257496 RepID=UPI0008E04F0D|nr:hypothetical protein [Curtobacterium sp. YR515]SFF50484.1 hypothetical protein SAMN05216329_1044 [Curtobacterium sp. YR515]